MGKKSRAKKELKAVRAVGRVLGIAEDGSWRPAVAARQAARDIEFEMQIAAVRSVLALYDPLDVAISLGVSELFLPNTASPVKHLFAWRIFVGIAPGDFANNRISSYPEFVQFVEKLYRALPSFPMLEDFSPEPDWGTVRARLDGEYVPMFYGSSIERTPDFVEAFRITFSGANEAIGDMDLALAIQHHMVTQFSSLFDNSELEVTPGNLTAPSENFWIQCRDTLQSAHDKVEKRLFRSSAALICEQGLSSLPKTESEFSDMCMRGNAWPFLGLYINKQFVPTSIRNGPATAIDYWAKHIKVNRRAWTGGSDRLAAFISDRFTRVHVGPLRFRTKAHILPAEVSAVIPTASGIYVIAFCWPHTLDDTARFACDFRNIVDSGQSWGIVPARGPAFELRNSAGLSPTPNEVKIIIVLAQGSTGFSSLSVPVSPARVMPLADFITIFDSLEDLDELERFWTFVDDSKKILSPFSQALADMFASFRDMSEVLVEGAVSPTLISLDPHWNSSWRYRGLSEFWAQAPLRFPDNSSAWKVRRIESGVINLRSNRHSAAAYSVLIGQCTVQFVVKFGRGSSSLTALHMIDLFARALADRLHTSREILANSVIFSQTHLVIECAPDPNEMIEDDVVPEKYAPGQLTVEAICIDRCELTKSANLKIFVSPVAIQYGLNDARDASFEAEALIRTIEACSKIFESSISEKVIGKIRVGANGPARFHLQVVPRTIDVPDFRDPVIPTAADYKLARRTLALKLQQLGFTPGRYELAEAKIKLDPARNALREHLDARIATLNATELIQACIEQNDELLAKDRGEIMRAQQSLNHEVDYDRIEAITETNRELGPLARHYRYLLEKTLSSVTRDGTEHVTPSVLKELIALIDWYMVLAGASDILHNELHVGGVEIDDSFIPEVFYSQDLPSQEEAYVRELAKTKLGVDIARDDAVEGESKELLESSAIRDAFMKDAGFDLHNLLDALVVLSQWAMQGFEEKLAFSYSASVEKITKAIEQLLPELSPKEAAGIVQFLTLCPTQIRRLDGKEFDEVDVPFWEHNKRLHRYAIRPLVPDGLQLRWGAEQASRAMTIWLSTVLHGYLPGDFKWPTVVQKVRSIKASIEKNLERRTVEIFTRHTPYVIGGVDFFRKFKGKGFVDVGDFDVLAYWPATNTLCYGECKYNQPAFSVKDSRRLRDRIFGSSPNDKNSQIIKVAGRRCFIEKHRLHMFELLGWPAPSLNHEENNLELYISREIHWWMANPPYEVPTKFVRVDALEAWITSFLTR